MIKTILVDDTPDLINLIKTVIQKNEAFEVLDVFYKTSDAKKFIINNEVDLIFVDMSMPEEDGGAFISYLNAINYNGMIAILSGHPYDSLSTKLSGLRYNWYFEKGEAISSMLKIITDHINDKEIVDE